MTRRCCLLPVALHPSPSVNVCVQISFSCKDTSHIGLGPAHLTLFYLNYLSTYSYIVRYLDLSLMNSGGNTIQPITSSPLDLSSVLSSSSLFFLSIPHCHQNPLAPFHCAPWMVSLAPPYWVNTHRRVAL